MHSHLGIHLFQVLQVGRHGHAKIDDWLPAVLLVSCSMDAEHGIKIGKEKDSGPKNAS